jgi:hypothetical protein
MLFYFSLAELMTEARDQRGVGELMLGKVVLQLLDLVWLAVRRHRVEVSFSGSGIILNKFVHCLAFK